MHQKYKQIKKINYRLNFKIDNILLKICENKKIDIKVLIKNTTQFIMMLDMTINEDIENILKFITDNYKEASRKHLEFKYQNVTVYITDTQKNVYKKILEDNRVILFNELLSIAINNNYFNFEEKKELINEHRIINKYSLEFLLDKKYKEGNIECLETIIKKLKYIIEKNYIVPSFYKKLSKEIFSFYKTDSYSPESFNSYDICIFLLSEFEKFYFILNLEYNMSLSNKNHYLRSYKAKYEKILISKYNNNIGVFIENEINFLKNKTKEEEVDFWLKFIKDFIIPEIDVEIDENNNIIFTDLI